MDERKAMRGILQVDPAGAVPIWKQIEEGVRRLVAAGALGPGAPVPSVRELARDLQVNPATVAKAYQRLVDAGLLAMRRGEGTFVTEDSAPLGEERRLLLRRGAAAFAGMARSLGLQAREAVEALEGAWAELDKGDGR
jgi:GntR family transcriptional regulator